MSYLKDREIWLSSVPTGNPPAGYVWVFIQNGVFVVRDSNGIDKIMATTTGTVTNATSASYVEYSNVASKPALVSGSSQVSYTGLSNIPVGIVSGSSQVSFNGITDKPALVSSSAQIVGYNVFATTGSNQFNGSQAVTGSLTVTGQVVAQTLNVQQVTSSIVYSSGSNIFGNSLGNTQQFTGSVSVTGSLTVNGAGTFASSVTANGDIYYYNAGNLNAIITSGAAANGRMYLYASATADIGLQAGGNSWFLNNLGIGTNSPSVILDVQQSNATNMGISFMNTFGATSNTAQTVDITSKLVGAGLTGQIGSMIRTGKEGDYSSGAARDAYMSFSTALNDTLTERMRITSDGNIIYTSNNASNASFDLNYRFSTPDSARIRFSTTTSFNLNEPGELSFWTRPNDSQGGGAIVERMRITSAGNVGIGTTTVNSKFIVVDNNEPNITGNITSGTQFAASIANGYASLNVGAYDNGSSIRYGYLRTAFSDGAQSGADMRFYTGPTERMRITSGGYVKASNNGVYNDATGSYHEMRQTGSSQNIVVFRNGGSDPYGLDVGYPSSSPNNTVNNFIYCFDGTAQRFSVRSNGGIANYSGNDVNLSDERVKKDIEPLESYWDKFKAIEIVKFKYKDQTHDDYNIGVIAQQVEAVAPEFVDIDGWGKTVNEEEPLKSIYTADLHHATIKVLQEAMTKIESLEAENDNLKSRLEVLEQS